MNWNKIIMVCKRIDSQLSDATYFHGRCLNGLEKATSHAPEREVEKRSKAPNAATGSLLKKA
jgi:hypothetical protein